jgi:lipid-binding SYLF domain-containing protein
MQRIRRTPLKYGGVQTCSGQARMLESWAVPNSGLRDPPLPRSLDDPADSSDPLTQRILMKMKITLATIGFTILALASSSTLFAASKAEINERVSVTLQQFDSLNTANRTLGDKAAGILVFPRVTKGGVGVAGEFGEGVLQVNGKTVGYYSVGSASVGLTLGLANHSEIIMFMTQESLDKFTSKAGWSIGADAGITVVSGGINTSYDTETVHKPILGFVFAEKGLIGDLSLEGSKISKIKG